MVWTNTCPRASRGSNLLAATMSPDFLRQECWAQRGRSPGEKSQGQVASLGFHGRHALISSCHRLYKVKGHKDETRLVHRVLRMWIKLTSQKLLKSSKCLCNEPGLVGWIRKIWSQIPKLNHKRTDIGQTSPEALHKSSGFVLSKALWHLQMLPKRRECQRVHDDYNGNEDTM